VSVVHIAPGAVDAASRETSPDRPLRGVARLEGSLVTLLDLARIMEDGDLAMFTRRAA
jgi:chemotaxis signal transduction protein